MSRAPLIQVVVIPLLLATISVAQQPATSNDAAPNASTATCNLDDGRQVYIRYTPVASAKEKLSNGKPFTPGGTPMTLFTEAQLNLGTSVIPVGAYTVYPIPAKDHWTLVINKNVTPGAVYDEKQDVARASMETAQVPQPSEALDIAFAHVGSRCSIRIYFGKSAAFADFFAK